LALYSIFCSFFSSPASAGLIFLGRLSIF
jgi:hypothetical protein